jgi:hypothetical protein
MNRPMTRAMALGVTTASILVAGSLVASAAPVYIELVESGYAAVVVGPGNGSASITNQSYGTFFIDSITAQGTPPLNEPDLNSTSIAFKSSNPAFPGGTLTVEISELNQFPLTGFNSFQSIFSTAPPGVPDAGFGTFSSLTEQTYVTTCAGATQTGCPAADAFATGNLLSTTTFTSTGGSVTKFASIPVDLSAPYVTTEIYTIVMQGGTYSEADASIDLSTSLLSGDTSATPIPGALPLFASGLGALGLFGWRRKRKNAAVPSGA